MQLGAHVLRNGLFVAPMAGVTDRPFRTLCRRFGAGLAVSEMVSARPDLRGSRKSRLRREHGGESGPVSVQIAGADPAQMALAARLNADEGAQIIDINMGCPAKKVCNVAAGSALLSDEALVGRILDAVVAATYGMGVPVTLKIRTGPDPASAQRRAHRAHRGERGHATAGGARPHARLRLSRRGRVRHRRRGEGRRAHPGDRQRRHRHARRSEARARRTPAPTAS